MWVSDHHQLDIMWLATAKDADEETLRMIARMSTVMDNRPHRPWLTVWRDYKTGMWLSYAVSFDTPNTDRVIGTFAEGCGQYGHPSDAMIDNGKDYRAYDFAGGRKTIKISIDNVAETRSMMSLLGVRVHFSRPYHAQSKPIERDFGTTCDRFSKWMPGYCGSHPKERPDELKKQLKKSAIPTFTEGVQALKFWIENHLHAMPVNGRNHHGLSRRQLWEDGFKGLGRVDEWALSALSMRTSRAHKIGRNGIAINGTQWYGPWMEMYKGTPIKAYLRLPSDPKSEEGLAFNAENHEYLGPVRADVFVTPGLAKTEQQQEQLRDVLRLRAQLEGAAKSAVTVPDVDLAQARAYQADSLETKIEVGYPIDIRNIDDALNHALSQPLIDAETGELYASEGDVLTHELITTLMDAGYTTVRVRPNTNITTLTAMDDVHAQDARMRATGTYPLTPPPKKQPTKFIRFRMDRK
jgi:hypothetical protein